MRNRFLILALLLLTLLLPVPRSQAQGRPLGPWRLTYQMVSEGKNDGWDVEPIKKTLKLAPTAVKWDVIPDSIRLFLNCENPLIAPAKPRKGQLPIRLTATGATVRLDTNHQRLLIEPSDSVVILSAFRGRVLVFKHIFKVIPPPLPSIEFWPSTRVNANDRLPLISFNNSLSLSIKVLPDEFFASLMPNDAKYRVSLSSITIIRDDVPLEPSRNVDGPFVDFSIFQSLLRPSDKAQVNVQLVQRQNFKGNVEMLPFAKQFVMPFR